MKRFLRFFLGAAAAACLCVSALAAASADLVRTFVYDGTLYTYVVLSGVTEPITKAEATVGGQVFPASDSLKTVRQAGSPVVEMLLVDCSNSMPDFASDVTAFAQTLAQASGENTRFLLATFGKEFTVLSARVEEGTCYLNLPSDADLGISPRQTVESLVLSLCSLDTVERVQIVVDGEIAAQLNGVNVGEPLTP